MDLIEVPERSHYFRETPVYLIVKQVVTSVI